jgi:short-subunit dehydrogenase
MILKDKTIIIYGASSGIGRALATELAKNNRIGTFSRRALDSRNDHEFEATREGSDSKSSIFKTQGDVSLSGNTVFHLQGDVRNTDHIQKSSATFKQQMGKIDGFIYSAGIAQVTDFEKFKADDAKKVMETNFFGFLNCLESWLPELTERKSGMIANVTGLMVNRSLPKGAAYFATKAAQHVFFEGLRMDMEDQGLEFFEIRPGLVDTPMAREAQVKSEKMWSAEKAAQHIIEQMGKGASDISFPLDLKVLTQSMTMLPDVAYFKLAKAQLDKNFRK